MFNSVGTNRPYAGQQNTAIHSGATPSTSVAAIRQTLTSPEAAAISSHLHHHFAPHFKVMKPASPNASQAELDAIRHAQDQNNELARICQARMVSLIQQGETPADMAAVEKTAALIDPLITFINSGIGGLAFALTTIGTNVDPKALEIFTAPDTAAAHNALTSAVSCVYASLADNASNDAFAGFKGTRFQKPADDKLHAALQASLVDKREQLDKNMFANAEKGGRDWLYFFLARNFAIFPITVSLTHQGKADLAAKIEGILRPLTALGMGAGINLLNDHRDNKNHLAGPAMIYGLRDAPDADGNRPAIVDEQEWKDTYNALKQLNTSKAMQMAPERIGEGIASTLNSIISSNVLKTNLTPAAIGGAVALAGGFALMSAGTTLIKERCERDNLTPAQTSLAAEAFKNVAGALAFDFWFMGAYLAEKLTNKATAAIDSHVPKAVEKFLTRQRNSTPPAIAMNMLQPQAQPQAQVQPQPQPQPQVQAQASGSNPPPAQQPSGDDMV
ncbi:hypothetical protein [Pseudomonas sp. LRF_L74]|uniref:hypothetical protein n=1 Tax=Pseudomonas sp. LRF_L74 TaxID=3369422 RepID=UPI003F6210A4